MVVQADDEVVPSLVDNGPAGPLIELSPIEKEGKQIKEQVSCFCMVK
jgi:hypothetical protein